MTLIIFEVVAFENRMQESPNLRSSKERYSCEKGLQ